MTQACTFHQVINSSNSNGLLFTVVSSTTQHVMQPVMKHVHSDYFNYQQMAELRCRLSFQLVSTINMRLLTRSFRLCHDGIAKSVLYRPVLRNTRISEGVEGSVVSYTCTYLHSSFSTGYVVHHDLKHMNISSYIHTS